MRQLGSVSGAAVGVASGLVVGADPKRTVIGIAAPANGQVTLSPSTPVVLGAGININQGNPIVWLRVEEFGDLVTKPLYGIASIATTIGVIEGTYLD